MTGILGLDSQGSSFSSLEVSAGVHIKDVHSIMIYLSRGSKDLYNNKNISQIDSWLEIIDSQFKPAIAAWASPYLGVAEYNEAVDKNVSKDVKTMIKDLDACLKKTSFLCGDSISLADISMGCELVIPFSILIDENTRKGMKSIVEWLQRLFQVPCFEKYWGPLALCSAPPVVPKAQAKEEAKKGKNVKQNKGEKKKKDVVIDEEEKARKQKERQEKKEKAAKEKAEKEKADKEKTEGSKETEHGAELKKEN